jgi:hypothetical protein
MTYLRARFGPDFDAGGFYERRFCDYEVRNLSWPFGVERKLQLGFRDIG